VIVREDLPKGFLAAHVAHAAGESGPAPPGSIAVVLGVPGEPELLTTVNCFLSVYGKRDSPSSPVYPVVFCAVCKTTWAGHRTDVETKIPNPRIPDALRDAVLLDQVERFEEILGDLGYKKTPPSEAREALHERLRTFLSGAFSQTDGKRWQTLDLVREPGPGYRDDQLRRWDWEEDIDLEIPPLVSSILEIAENEAEARTEERQRFKLRIYQYLGGRALLTFTINSSAFCVRTEAT
jgi:hypothetical protein